MTPYYSDAAVTIYRGDCRDVLRDMEPDSVDACVCDPPYELGFMGKKWDSSGIAYRADLWREVRRVLKPGAHLLAFGGTRTYHRMASAIEDAGFEVRDSLMWIYGQGFPKSLNIGGGLGTALKPSHEPVVLARKPLAGTVAANVAKHGTGALNVDACRIEGPPAEPFGNPTQADGYRLHKRDINWQPSDEGRWPANVLLDEQAALVLDEQSGELTDGVAVNRNRTERLDSPAGFAPRGISPVDVGYGGSGGASRFFYVAKPSREERDMGCEGLRLRSGGECTDRDEGSAGLNNPRAGAGRTGGGRNIHPTVKPIELMRWLVRLVTPIDGVVLDPFMGSGTTGCACVYEQRRFIGIEREADYIEIARRRIAAVAPLFTEAVEPTRPVAAVDPGLPLTGTD